ncbi:MAG: ArsC family reductase [Betaproteobacteria bacterium]
MAEARQPSAKGAASGPVVFGISNCDQVRKARAWLQLAGVDYRFHDFRADGLDGTHLAVWMRHVPWDALLNRRGTTWRRLDEARRASVTDQRSAIELMLAEPTLVKRPVLQHGQRILVGFSEPLYAALFGPAHPAPAT